MRPMRSSSNGGGGGKQIPRGRAAIVVLAVSLLGADSSASSWPVNVDPMGRYLVDRDGKPFFWLGDTAWLLFQVPNREDIELYLATRAKQGFTVIQAAAVMGEERVCGTAHPNAHGDTAFVENDPGRPRLTAGEDPRNGEEYDYWDHADYVVDRAVAHGLVLGLLPLFVGSGGDGYKYLKLSNAEAYGKFLGERYRSRPNIVWILERRDPFRRRSRTSPHGSDGGGRAQHSRRSGW